MLFVDLNGHIQISGESNDTPAEDPQAQQETQFGTLARFQNPESSEASSLEELELPSPEIEPAFVPEEFVPEESLAENLPKNPAENPPENLVESGPDSFEPPIGLETLEPEEFEDTTPVEDFVDQEAEVGGPLSYTVTLERIDTKNLRAQLQDVFDDPKFQWSSADLMKRIRQGKITLKNLSPVKASVLISHVKELPLKISWVQQVYK
jgi:hypothetical protein